MASRHGGEDLIIRLIEEAPQLKEEKVLLYRLLEWAAEEKLADYDIQCYNRDCREMLKFS